MATATQATSEVTGILVRTGKQDAIEIKFPREPQDAHHFLLTLLRAWKEDLTAEELKNKALETPNEQEMALPISGSPAFIQDGAGLCYLVHGGEPHRFGLKPNPRASRITGHGSLYGPIVLFCEEEEGANLVFRSLSMRDLGAKCWTPEFVAPILPVATPAKDVEDPNVLYIGRPLLYHGPQGAAVTCQAPDCFASAVAPVTTDGKYYCLDHHHRH